MPPNTVYVGRPTKWGNPFRRQTIVDSIEGVLRMFWEHLESRRDLDLSELRGKDLACWCKENSPCHADILLELANR
jgi:hypothetical protein